MTSRFWLIDGYVGDSYGRDSLQIGGPTISYENCNYYAVYDTFRIHWWHYDDLDDSCDVSSDWEGIKSSLEGLTKYLYDEMFFIASFDRLVITLMVVGPKSPEDVDVFEPHEVEAARKHLNGELSKDDLEKLFDEGVLECSYEWEDLLWLVGAEKVAGEEHRDFKNRCVFSSGSGYLIEIRCDDLWFVLDGFYSDSNIIFIKRSEYRAVLINRSSHRFWRLPLNRRVVLAIRDYVSGKTTAEELFKALGHSDISNEEDVARTLLEYGFRKEALMLAL